MRTIRRFIGMTGFRKAPWISIVNCGSCNGCDIECLTLMTPRYDIERFGCVIRPSARDADILLITGALTEQSRERLSTIFRQIPHQKKVIAVGNCAISGCVFRNSYNIKGTVDEVIPVDMYISGCPPRPEAIIHGILKVLGGLNKTRNKRKKN